MKYLILTFLGLALSFASFAIYPLTGDTVTCIGLSTSLSDSTTGGIWSSSNTAIATVSATGGYSANVTGVSAGTCTITYAVGLAYVTVSYTVSGTYPAAITGTTTFCMGTSSALSDATPGGAWSSSHPAVGSVSATGLVTGVAAGSATITYSLPSGCSVNTAVTITTTATVDPIAGLTSVCSGSTITLTDGTSGGTWSSSSPPKQR